jgi:glycosyltransferase involved in cell wall biosynthesis
LRILVVSQTFPKRPGDSTAPFLASMVSILAARGHELDVVIPHHPDFCYPASDRIRFVPYRYLPNGRSGFSPWGFGSTLTGTSRVSPQAALVIPAALAALRQTVARALMRAAYDVVHAHWLLPNGWIASGPARRRGVRLVITLHGSDVAIAERTRLFGALARRALDAADAVTAVSDDLRLRAQRLGADARKVRTVHLGVDTAAFRPAKPDPAWRARLGAQGDAVLVVTVGRLVEVKGFRYLIEAVARAEGTHLAIIGEGDLRRELERIVRETGASVTFVGDLDHSEIPAVLAAADVVGVPSVIDRTGRVDGLPTTLLEALACGRPVVASGVAGIPDVVVDGVNGLLVPEKDVSGLASALVTLRDEQRLRDRLGQEARVRAVAELDWSATAEAFEEAYAGSTKD